MTAFVAGKTYIMTSACDSDCRWDYKITRRTAKCVWIEAVTGSHKYDGRKGIRVWGNVECISPFGTYSMSPILAADKPA